LILWVKQFVPCVPRVPIVSFLCAYLGWRSVSLGETHPRTRLTHMGCGAPAAASPCSLLPRAPSPGTRRPGWAQSRCTSPAPAAAFGCAGFPASAGSTDASPPMHDSPVAFLLHPHQQLSHPAIADPQPLRRRPLRQMLALHFMQNLQPIPILRA